MATQAHSQPQSATSPWVPTPNQGEPQSQLPGETTEVTANPYRGRPFVLPPPPPPAPPGSADEPSSKPANLQRSLIDLTRADFSTAPPSPPLGNGDGLPVSATYGPALQPQCAACEAAETKDSEGEMTVQASPSPSFSTLYNQLNPLSPPLQRKAATPTPIPKPSYIDLTKVELFPQSVAAAPTVQRQENTGTGNARVEVEEAIQHSRGQGQPLADPVREQMEGAIGADFSGVRVHTDSQADGLNQSLQAKAFTTGQDIYLKQGEFKPGSQGGQALLAHELTHVVQQTGGIRAKAKPNKVQMKLARSPLPGLQAFNYLQRQQRQTEEQSDGKQAENRQPNNEQAQDTVGVSQAPPPANLMDEGNQTESAPMESSTEHSASPVDGGNAAGESSTSVESAAASDQVSSPADAAGASGAGANVGGLGTEGAAAESPASESGSTVPASPQEDPGFQAVVGAIGGVASQEQAHNPAETEAGAAQAAAQSPSNEVESQAQHQQAGVMDQQQPGAFNAEAFKAQLLTKIAAIIPDTEEKAKDFGNNNELDSVRADVSSQASEERARAAGSIEEATQAEPDTSQIEARTPTPLESQPVGTATTDVGAERVAPPPRPETEISTPLQENVQDIDQQMAEANVTEEQLANSNEPEFQGALAARGEVRADAAQAPGTYRQQEQGIISQTQTDAQATSQQELGAMHGSREQLLGAVTGQQAQTQAQDEGKRAEIAGEINKIYELTKTDVEGILNGLDGEVTSKFDTAAASAKQVFESYVQTEMDKWEDERYGEWYDVTGWDERISDAWSLPPEVNKFFVDGKQKYMDAMDVALTDIANHVATKLNEAKARIAQGRQEIQEYVNSLDPGLQQIGQEAAGNIQAQFDELENSVNNKQDELIDSLAQQYSDSLGEVNARIEEMKEANRGLKDKAMDAMGGAIQTILELKNMLTGVLAQASGAIDKIILDPIGFLGNLVDGVKQGFNNFVGNIWQHLKKGLIGWLTGALASAGVQIPDSFDLIGIFKLVMQVLGLAYDAIKSRTIQALGSNGERIFNALEKTFEIFVVLTTEGIGGLWQFIQDKVGDLKVMVLDTIQNFVIENVITQGVMWVISLLNPASAFVKACKMIYDVIMFFVERGRQIVDLVNAVMGSVTSIAEGALSVAANLIEGALSKALPVVISFMASLLGLGGISDKVRDIITAVKAPIDKAIDWIIAQAVKFAKKMGKALGFGRDVEDGDSSSQTAEGEGEQLEDTEVGKTVNFNAGGEGHRLWIKTQGTNTEVMVASENPGPVETKLNEWQGRLDSLSEEDKPRAQSLLATARQQLGTTDQSAQKTAVEMQEAKQDSANEAAIDEAEAADNQTEAAQQTLSGTLQQLFTVFDGQNQVDREVIVPFRTEKESHQLKARISGDEVVLEMASSNFSSAIGKVKNFMELVSDKLSLLKSRHSSGEINEFINDIQTLHNVLTTAQAEYQSLLPNSTQEDRQFISEESLKNVAVNIGSFLDEYLLGDFGGQGLVFEFVIDLIEDDLKEIGNDVRGALEQVLKHTPELNEASKAVGDGHSASAYAAEVTIGWMSERGESTNPRSATQSSFQHNHLSSEISLKEVNALLINGNRSDAIRVFRGMLDPLDIPTSRKREVLQSFRDYTDKVFGEFHKEPIADKPQVHEKKIIDALTTLEASKDKYESILKQYRLDFEETRPLIDQKLQGSTFGIQKVDKNGGKRTEEISLFDLVQKMDENIQVIRDALDNPEEHLQRQVVDKDGKMRSLLEIFQRDLDRQLQDRQRVNKLEKDRGVSLGNPDSVAEFNKRNTER